MTWYRSIIVKTPLLNSLVANIRYRYFLFNLNRIDKREKENMVDGLGIAIPPAKLRYRVHGNLKFGAFLNVGKAIANNIKNQTRRCGIEFRDFQSVLDFGCGSARVMRYFINEYPDKNYTGIDIDEELIVWCKNNIENVTWHQTPPLPPTELASGSFDFIYGISVFTHLDQEYQNAWLRELRRIIKPDGTIFLTTHGEHYLKTLELDRDHSLEFQEKEFLFIKRESGKYRLDGLPDFYQTAVQTQSQIHRDWTEYFKIIGYFEGAVNQIQDSVILKPSATNSRQHRLGS